MLDRLKDNSKYDLKTIKIKPDTYNKLIKAKARLEFERTELHSFDGLIDHLLDIYFIDGSSYVTNDPKKLKGDNDDGL